MHWILLLFAIALEVTGQTFLKIAHGWTRLLPLVCAMALAGSSFLVYSVAIKKIDLSIAYPMWSGLGTAAITLIGIIVFKENVSLLRGVFIAVIVIGISGLFMVK